MQIGPHGSVVSKPLPIKLLSLVPRRATWIKAKMESVYVKSERYGALKPGKLNLA